jgi:hypothetical protein
VEGLDGLMGDNYFTILIEAGHYRPAFLLPPTITGPAFSIRPLNFFPIAAMAND